MTPALRLLRLLLVLTLALAAPPSFAQRERGPDGRVGPPRGAQAPARMSAEERQQLHRDLREQPRGERQPPHRLSPEERERMRRDMHDANRRFERR
ncbi:MAG TPA: hypothetical protein VIS77_15550 [Burkholderiales bacterium]